MSGYRISVTIFGGFAPFVATWLIAVTGASLSPSFYLMFTAGLSIIALMVVRQREFRGTFDAPKPPPRRPDDRGSGSLRAPGASRGQNRTDHRRVARHRRSGRRALRARGRARGAAGADGRRARRGRRHPPRA